MDKTLISKKLWESIRVAGKNIEKSMNPLKRKRTGSYYTDLDLTDVMMQELVNSIDTSKKRIIDYTFFEPCVGSGNFVFSYIKAIKEKVVSKEEAIILLNNIYVADINIDALQVYKKSLSNIVYECWKLNLSEEYFSKHIGTGLLIDVTSEKLRYISVENVFSSDVVKDGFDIVVTNPPYKKLKAECDYYENAIEYEKDKAKYAVISKIIEKNFKYSLGGVLNLYKLFVEEIIERYTNKNSYISLLIPSSILSDKTCEKLRTHILCNSSLLSVKVISEGSGYIDAQQSLCAMLISKGEKSNKIKITKDYCNYPEENVIVPVSDIMNEYTGNSIFAISNDEYKVYKKLKPFPVVKQLNFIVNSRGELDLTTGKQFITKEKTKYSLIRGRNIGFYKLINKNEEDFVLEDFVKKTQKKQYIENDRIICQQIANMKKERRVTFTYIPKNYILGNSCNFISVNPNIYGIDIYTLLGLFNSKYINWLFKLTSSNNHINNYEIDNFPVPVNSKFLQIISKKVQEYIKTKDEKLIDDIEQLTIKAYEIDDNEEENNIIYNDKLCEYLKAIKSIISQISEELALQLLDEKIKIDLFFDGLNKFECNVAKGITEKYIALNKGYILNHTTFKLSNLDLEMIKAVPQGGNWKNIPCETVEKSKRLIRIRETGGRTTLYGRIDYSKPSYTITTYFNRPGNGTYVHPIHQRVISVREAARFQTFRDDYYFYGNKTQLLKQVGNAVPTLLAYQIGREIKKKTGCDKSIDLFCGAGGMTAGFKEAGIKSLLCNDIEESACITLKINNPKTRVLCGDITKPDIKNIIGKVALESGADIICGGPPCQGFSMAGFRSTDDPRNQLFHDFVSVVEKVNPKIIVFENVEGLLSYQGGKTYREVHQLFEELGYNTEGRILMANEYAVPQKRKRVFIICTRKNLNILPTELFPPKITIDSDKQVTSLETIGDLEMVQCNDVAEYIDVVESDIVRLFKGKMSYEEYINVKTPKKSVVSLPKCYELYEQLTFELV